MSFTYDVWKPYHLFFSAPFTQKYLYNQYKSSSIADAEQRSFKNCYPFIYYLEHSKNYYQTALKSHTSMQPVLLFYGLSQLLKACLLIKNPVYPENTAVLAHGVSTRKRKKQSYDFLDDEVKIQKNGLFSEVGRELFHMKQLEGQKYTMTELLGHIDEMYSLFNSLNPSRVSKKLLIGNVNNKELIFPNEIKESYHMDNTRLHPYLQDRFKIEMSIQEINPTLRVSFSDLHTNLYQCSPLLFNLETSELYLTTSREQCVYFPEILSHYLILYNLSMISRYETEWWYELLHTYSSKDYPYVMNFLEITSIKAPYLLFNYLHSQIKKD
ncbi:YaaC family protein [Priestia flexa]|uniref:YaaC family protein n=1 Tax=Priestia flexa TaxID=86664 RepID=UPI001B32D262|nr:YaaC family protein [Priestia flexa]